MRTLYYQECDSQKVLELDYLVMRLTDTMQDMEVAITKLREKHQLSQSERDDAIDTFIQEYEPYLKNIVEKIIRRFFPEKNVEDIANGVQKQILRVVK